MNGDVIVRMSFFMGLAMRLVFKSLRLTLCDAFNQLNGPLSFKDHCPNGLSLGESTSRQTVGASSED